MIKSTEYWIQKRLVREWSSFTLELEWFDRKFIYSFTLRHKVDAVAVKCLFFLYIFAVFTFLFRAYDFIFCFFTFWCFVCIQKVMMTKWWQCFSDDWGILFWQKKGTKNETYWAFKTWIEENRKNFEYRMITKNSFRGRNSSKQCYE